MADVFISYKRRLRPQVTLIANALREAGLSVWYDAGLEAGSHFSAEISREVRRAKCVLVCWSNDAFEHGGDRHGWVIAEATIGLERGVLVPVLLEEADLDPPWNVRHTESLVSWAKHLDTPLGYHQAWSSILRAIGEKVGQPHLGSPALGEERHFGRPHAPDLRSSLSSKSGSPQASAQHRHLTTERRSIKSPRTAWMLGATLCAVLVTLGAGFMISQQGHPPTELETSSSSAAMGTSPRQEANSPSTASSGTLPRPELPYELIRLSEDGFVIPDSSSRALTYEELSQFNGWELYVARNEIYARHGDVFATPCLDRHFRRFAGEGGWYRPVPEMSDAELVAAMTAYEQDNRELIQQRESEIGGAFSCSRN